MAATAFWLQPRSQEYYDIAVGQTYRAECRSTSPIATHSHYARVETQAEKGDMQLT